MSNLTPKQQEVLDAISTETNTAKAIAEQLDTTVQSVNSTLTALEKKGHIIKNPDKTVQVGANRNSTQSTQVSTDTEVRANRNSTQSTQVRANHQSPITNPQSIPVLIPYIHSGNGGEELKYAIRSLSQNLDTDIEVIVVGDTEDWFHDQNITHLSIDRISPTQGEKEVNPQVDVAGKIIAAIASLALEGDIILTNDDIFLLGKTKLSDLGPFAFGNLDNAGKPNGIYHTNALRSKKALEKNELPTHRYGTHTPVIVNAGKLAEVIEKYKATEQGHLLTSLYFNDTDPDYRPVQIDGGLHDPILASVYKSDPKLGPLHNAVQKRKFMNCNTAGWKAVHPIMKSLFPNKSKFEK